MKKLITGIAVMAFLFLVNGSIVLAAGHARGRNMVDTGNEKGNNYNNTVCQFLDADGDGICDNYNTGSCGTGAGRGAGYVDADGDGICDNYAAGASQNGTGSRRGQSGGQGRKGRCGRR